MPGPLSVADTAIPSANVADAEYVEVGSSALYSTTLRYARIDWSPKQIRFE
jgi:hypothetical protein